MKQHLPGSGKSQQFSSKKILCLLFFVMTVFSRLAFGQIEAWQFGSPASAGNEVTYNATTHDANLNTSVLSRGAGITATALVRAFAGTGFPVGGDKTNALNNNRYFSFTIVAGSGYQVSLSTLDAQLRRTSTGPNAYIWRYSTDGTNFTDIGTDISFTSTADGVAQTQINLGGISALQNVASTTTITLRLYAWGATNTGGTFSIGRFGTGVTTNSLAIGGTVGIVSSTPSLFVTASSLAFGNQITATNSASQRDSISGANLTGAPDSITVKAPSTDFQVSKDDIVWADSIKIPFASATLSNTPFYVRFTPQSTGLKTGNITFSGGGATTPPTVAVSGTGTNQFPSVASSNLVFSSVTTSSVILTFTIGDGAKRIVVAHPGSTITYTPTNGTPPSGINSNYGLATDQGSGSKIVFDSSGASVTVTGLTSGEKYYFEIYEYNGSGVNIFYLTSPFLAGNTTIAGPIYYSTAGSTYTQNFNTLPASGTYTLAGTGPTYVSATPINTSGNASVLNGWQFGATTGSPVKFAFNDGASNTGSMYSYGTSGSSDRAFGVLISGSLISVMGATIRNTSPDILTTVTVSFSGEQWRKGGSSSCLLKLSYVVGGTSVIDSLHAFTDVSALNFFSPQSGTAGALDGNQAANRLDIPSATFNLNANWFPGQDLVIRWDEIKGAGSADGLAVDSFAFSATGPSAPTAQDSTITFSNTNTIATTVDWLNGDGIKRIVVMNTSGSFTNPVNGVSPAANPVYSGSGQQVVYNGTGTTVNISGLTAGTQYFFRVFSYNGTDTTSKYNVSSAFNNPNSITTVAAAPPTKLVVLSVNGGVSPVVNRPFSMVVQAQDAANNPQNVALTTGFDISVFNGIGSILGGTTSGSLSSGANTVTVSGIKYNPHDLGVQLQVSRTSGDTPLASGLSDFFDVFDTAAYLFMASQPSSGIVNTVVGSFSVQALAQDASLDGNYADSITLSVASGPGTISGTLTKAAVAGVADFSNIVFSQPGTYTVRATAANLTDVVSTNIIITAVPIMTEIIVPKYIACKTTGTNNSRTPIAICLSIANLVPSTAYDIRAGLDLTSAVSTSFGAGNVWSGTTIVASTMLNAFTTDGSGNSGPFWIYLQPTENSTRFGAGQVHNVRIGYVAHGGLSPSTPHFVGSKTITALDIPSSATTTGTTDDGAFLKGSTSSCIGGKYILIYDNVAGTGDPLFAYQARQATPVDTVSTNYAALPSAIKNTYLQNASSAIGDWPAVIPTGANNPNGVRRVEARNNDNTIFNFATDADGIWPGGANTTTIGRGGIATLSLGDAGMSTVAITGVSSTQASCVGANDGTATVTATGFGTLTYLWSNGATTSTASSLAAGVYTVTVSDSYGCSAVSANDTVHQPAASTITASRPTTFCVGDSTVLSAGAGADHYSWSTNPSTDTLQSIIVKTSGTYTVTVTTGTCTQTSLPVTVIVNSFSSTGTLFSENMGNPGSITAVNLFTGWQNTSPVTFSSTSVTPPDVRTTLPSTGYTGSSGQGNIFMGTGSGDTTRNVIISGINTLGYSNIVLSFGLLRDATTGGLTVEVSADSVYTPLTITQPASANAWTLVTASGVIPNASNLKIRFSKSNSTSFRIDDVKLSVTATSASVTPPGPITICGSGSVTLTSNLPTGNLWSPGSENTHSIAVTTTGNYSVTVTDLNGCTSSSSPVNVRFVPTVSVAVTSTTPAGCSGGSATALASGGTAPFNYSWNSSPVQNTATATALPAGTYTVSVSDSNSCTASATTTIGQPAASTITPSGNTVFCNGDSVILSAGSGVSYVWSSGATTQSIIVKTSGTYTVTVDDGLGCVQASLPVTVTVNNFSVTGTLFSENMGSGASTTVVNSYTGWQNNSAPIVFTSTTTPPSDVRNSTQSSGYTGASGNGDVFMNNTTSNSRDFNIAGINTLGYSGITLKFGLRRDSGTDSLTVETSSDGIAYNLLTKIPGSTTWTLYSATGSIPATANLRVRFSKNNSSVFRIDDVKITGTTSAVTISSSGPTTICGPGSVILTSNVSTGNIWTPASQTTQSITVSADGAYSVSVTDTNGCQSSSTPVTVKVVPAVTVAVTSTTNASCNGFTDGQATAVASGGTAPINYSWNSVPVQTTNTALNLGAGTYTVTVTDSNSCTANASTTVTQPSAISLTAVISDSIICLGDSVSLSSTGTSTSFLTFSNSTPVSIPDSSVGSGITPVASSIVVSGLNITSLSGGLLANVKINSLTHTFDGDLIIRLVAPDGRYLTLSNRRGGAGDNFTNTTFTQSATTAISTASASFTGTFIPDSTGVTAAVAFSAFNGVNPNGTWQLVVSDNAPADIGSLNSWSISFFNPLVFSWTSSPSGFTSADKSPGYIIPSTSGNIVYTVVATNNTTGCSVSSSVDVDVTNCGVTLNLNVFLEGYYQSPGTAVPMEYQNSGYGMLGIDAFIDLVTNVPDDVDTMIVSLVDSANLATNFDVALATLETQTGIVKTTGALQLSFSGSAVGSTCYVRVQNNRHIEIWSATPMVVSSSNSYDFTTDSTQAYSFSFGNPFPAMKEMEPGKWAMYTGEQDADQAVTIFDIPILIGQFESGTAVGYFSGDLDGSCDVTIFDIPLMNANLEYLGIGVYAQQPPY